MSAAPIAPAKGDSYRHGMKVGFLRHFRSDAMKRSYGVGVPWISIALAGVLCLTIVGIPAALGILIARWIRYSRASSRYEATFQAARRCEPISSYVLMCDGQLKRLKNVIAPGLVIGTFSRKVAHDYFVELARFLYEIKASEPQTDAERFVYELFKDETYRPGRRRKLPAELTAGIEVFAFDLLIDNRDLPLGILNSPLIPCMAVPGESGLIFTLPWWLTGDPHDWLLMIGETNTSRIEASLANDR